MTQRPSATLYTPTSKVNDQCIAVFQCNSAIDSDWVFQTEGTNTAGGSDDAIQAKFAIIDNLVNSTGCTIKFGNQQYGISPFTRRTFALPDSTPLVEILLTSGIVVLTLCQNDMNVPDEQDQAAASQVGTVAGEYNPYFSCTGPTPVSSQVLLVHSFERACAYQQNFNGFEGAVSPQAGVNPASDYVVSVYNNVTLIGTLTYHTNGSCTAATVGGNSGVVAVGDVLTIIGNVTPDGSIENFGGTFAMTPA